MTAEFVTALREFEERDGEWNRPRAWNFELGFRPSELILLAARVEGSSELEDAPKCRFGLGTTVEMHEQLSVILEYLRGTYRKALSEEEDELDIKAVDTLVVKLVFVF